ncbi:nucleotidyltransferase domain-containing protein [Hydrogenivirga sp. 128-5-R1-1]|uniref:nucleotidyltransferase domain-containing protein n=1 Tax=Hydrogenivirga sp. 128-5-R1-1 TaxID=392423 RepID=UPI00015F0C16|nr:nucleotidyltransferase domain-containing protein [Hydrogenivirga sp. 128-5-R1-1]EDP73584.1 DNA polymerase, beta-like region [Hydrogenivirga sp. 128-5-R1-1]
MNRTKKVRLKEEEINVIKTTIKQFDPEAKIFIYGSRADLSKKGGDIDILIISDKISLQEQLKIKAKLITKLGDRKIDLVIAKNPKETSFVEMIYNQAVEI